MVEYYDSEIDLDGEVPVLAVSGETDLFTAPRFKRDVDAVLSVASDGVILDFTRLEFIESTGLAILLFALRQALDEGRSLVLVITRRHTLRVLAITGLLDAFSIASTREEALEALADGRPLRRAA